MAAIVVTIFFWGEAFTPSVVLLLLILRVVWLLFGVVGFPNGSIFGSFWEPGGIPGLGLGTAGVK